MKKITLFLVLLGFLSSCSEDEGSIDPSPTTPDHSWAPLNRTTSSIYLAEEDTLIFDTDFLQFDFYRNTAYSCGFSGNYTFLVVEPMNNPGGEAPLWVYLHGGGYGYFDENQQYKIGVRPTDGVLRNPNQHNTEKTLERLRNDELIYNTPTNSGQIENSTLMEGYRIFNCFYERS